MKSEYEVLRRGFDTLDVAFQGSLPAAGLALLREAKSRAVKEQSPELLELGGVLGHVGTTGANCYAFRFDTGPEGEIWTIKDNTDPEQWNLRVQVRALNLAMNGYDGVKSDLFKTLEAWKAKVLSESVSRIDFAVDFVLKDFVLNIEDFSFHSHSRCMDYRDIPEGGSGLTVARKAGAITGVTIGKMPGRQVTVYDKRREQIYKVGSPWFGIWGFKKDDCPPVWRVELRAGKNHLKAWDVTTFDHLEAKITDIYGAALQSVRLLRERADNVTRSELHPLWHLVKEQVQGALLCHMSSLNLDDVLKASADEIREMYRKQLLGLGISYAVALGMTQAEAEEDFIKKLSSDWGRMVAGEPKKYAEKFQKTVDRLIHLRR